MPSSFLVITSIAGPDHPVLKMYAEKAQVEGVCLLTIGDRKSPGDFDLSGCDFYSLERQLSLPLSLGQNLPYNHYARKNIGYLVAASRGAEIIIETDDDNLPYPSFWDERKRMQNVHVLDDCGWSMSTVISLKNTCGRGAFRLSISKTPFHHSVIAGV